MRDDGTEYRLAVYGSLAPGRENHCVLSGMTGTWEKGWVRGRLHQEGWGATRGYPAIVLDPRGQDVEVQVFTSEQLPEHWKRIDEFEGPEYRRVLTEVLMDLSVVACTCNIYELNKVA
jgi:gamma-glutamylcyclotransferase (GGCT)/AIG2-like uncharacterized protein YtfP